MPLSAELSVLLHLCLLASLLLHLRSILRWTSGLLSAGVFPFPSLVCLAIGSHSRVTLCLFQESPSPGNDAIDSKSSTFEPAVGSQEKLDFNRNLKEGEKDFGHSLFPYYLVSCLWPPVCK